MTRQLMMHQRSIKQFLGLFAGIVLCLILVRSVIGCLIPYHFGGRELSEKIRYIEKTQKQVDILFMGSSRVRRGIIPAQFDSLLSGRNRTAISFNLGGPAASVGENLYLLKHYSASAAGVYLKTVVIEWPGEYLPGSRYYKTERARYWMDLRSFKQQVSLLFVRPGLVSAWREGSLSYLFSTLIHRNIGLSRIRIVMTNKMVPDTSLDENRGYAPLKAPHARLISSGPIIPGESVYDTLQAGRDREKALQIHSLKDIDPVTEDVDLWLGLIRQYKERGIKLILLIPPGPVTVRQLALARRIPSENLVDLSHPMAYPDLYDPAIFHDFVHLNHEGAQRFTKHIADLFLKQGIHDIKP